MGWNGLSTQWWDTSEHFTVNSIPRRTFGILAICISFSLGTCIFLEIWILPRQLINSRSIIFVACGDDYVVWIVLNESHESHCTAVMHFELVSLELFE